MTALLVVLGACVGAPARYIVGRVLPSLQATLVVNALGSLAVGGFAGLGPRPFALLGVGLCGSFTTFSAFAVETIGLPRWRAAAYVLVSVASCCLACELGLALS